MFNTILSLIETNRTICPPPNHPPTHIPIIYKWLTSHSPLTLSPERQTACASPHSCRPCVLLGAIYRQQLSTLELLMVNARFQIDQKSEFKDENRSTGTSQVNRCAGWCSKLIAIVHHRHILRAMPDAPDKRLSKTLSSTIFFRFSVWVVLVVYVVKNVSNTTNSDYLHSPPRTPQTLARRTEEMKRRGALDFMAQHLTLRNGCGAGQKDLSNPGPVVKLRNTHARFVSTSFVLDFPSTDPLSGVETFLLSRTQIFMFSHSHLCVSPRTWVGKQRWFTSSPGSADGITLWKFHQEFRMK